MEDRDFENITYSHSVDSISTPGGQKFLRDKYLPKIEFIKAYFTTDWRERRILDIGIGYGSFLNLLEQHGFKHLYGMDPFKKSIEISRRFTTADLREGDIENELWPFARESFDVITSFDVVEHLNNPQTFFINSKEYLKEDGVVVFSTPNKQLPYYLRSIPMLGIPDKNPTHINVHPPSYWTKMAESCGYTTLKKWKGEHLTHVKWLPPMLKKLCTLFKVDPRTVPVINWFEQSFCMAITPLASDQRTRSSKSPKIP